MPPEEWIDVILYIWYKTERQCRYLKEYLRKLYPLNFSVLVFFPLNQVIFQSQNLEYHQVRMKLNMKIWLRGFLFGCSETKTSWVWHFPIWIPMLQPCMSLQFLKSFIKRIIMSTSNVGKYLTAHICSLEQNPFARLNPNCLNLSKFE